MQSMCSTPFILTDTLLLEQHVAFPKLIGQRVKIEQLFADS